MSRSLSSASSLDTLRKEARRWLKALRAGDAAARHRLLAATPDAPLQPTLRDVQFALAREHGLAGWNALREAVESLALERLTEAERIDVVLRSCDWGGNHAAAARLLQRWPSSGRGDFLSAVIRGDVAAVEQALAADPGLAARPAGPLRREPLQYLAYARVPGDPDGAVQVARLLLDHGADPGAAWKDAWENPFTVLCGVIGLGEGLQPPHPRGRELAALLLERGADPLDTQALYNTSIVDDDVSWLELLWRHSEQRGLVPRWLSTRDGAGIGGKLKLAAIDYLLGNAISYGHERRARWLLEHGARAAGRSAYSGRPLREEALIHAQPALAALLERFGAPATPPSDQTAFQLACFALDRTAAAALALEHPEFLRDAGPLTLAATRNRADVVGLLLELGTPVDVADGGGVRALQRAVGADARAAVDVLLAHGADVDRPSQHYGGAMGFAAHFGRRELAARLAPLSRDVHNLVWCGMKERLRELFTAEPALVDMVHPSGGITPLFALCDDEALALEMAEFLLAHGADRRRRDRDGLAPADAAARRGLLDVADLLEL